MKLKVRWFAQEEETEDDNLLTVACFLSDPRFLCTTEEEDKAPIHNRIRGHIPHDMVRYGDEWVMHSHKAIPNSQL